MKNSLSCLIQCEGFASQRSQRPVCVQRDNDTILLGLRVWVNHHTQFAVLVQGKVAIYTSCDVFNVCLGLVAAVVDEFGSKYRLAGDTSVFNDHSSATCVNRSSFKRRLHGF